MFKNKYSWWKVQEYANKKYTYQFDVKNRGYFPLHNSIKIYHIVDKELFIYLKQLYAMQILNKIYKINIIILMKSTILIFNLII